MVIINTENEKNQAASTPQKSFMTVGPTLHYSHTNVVRFWLLSLTVYVMACLFWSMIVAGSFAPFDFAGMLNPEKWRLEGWVLRPLSIFAYPWQIAVLGLVMGMMAVIPPLVSQLLSFRHSLPYLLAIEILANLPAFAIFVLVSCIAAAARPLRFRSRFIAIAMCIAPQLFYWAYFGGLRNTEPLRWGFSFAPWVCAWLVALAFAGIVLSVGHFTRYRPGLCWLVGLITLTGAVLILHYKIGFDELAYQRYVAENDPEGIVEFHDQSITKDLDAAIHNPEAIRYFSNFFYPTEPVMLREKLKEEVQTQLNNDRWPFWFPVADELSFGPKRQWLLGQYEQFITYPEHWWMPSTLSKKLARQRASSARMPAALYYKAMLSEMMPDLTLIMEKESLHFYNDYPHWRCWPIWYKLYEQFPQSSESLEARLRLATHLAGNKQLFQKADDLLQETHRMIANKLKEMEQEQAQTASLAVFSSFAPPPSSAMTAIKLTELQRRRGELARLISAENYTIDAGTRARLARFIALNPHSLEYPAQLEALLVQTDEKDPLRDNLLLAKIRLIKDLQLQGEQLKALNEKYKDRDAGIAALYELALLKVRLSQQLTGVEQKKRQADARNTLEYFISTYPKSNFAANAQSVLDSLPH
ncbi:MAG: hypothetical protein Q7T18_11330 [Sedimentisphaerales bacterium]|nr:hypothetical protein [Sedimentisphaerales bacterium]